MSKLPREIWKEIGLGLPISDLLHLCAVSKEFHEMCEDNHFWKQVYQREFGVVKGNPKNINYKEEVKSGIYRGELVDSLYNTVYLDYPRAKLNREAQEIHLAKQQTHVFDRSHKKHFADYVQKFPELKLEFFSRGNGDKIITYEFRI